MAAIICNHNAAYLDRIKGPWSPEEDSALQRYVQKYGPRNWSLISKAIPGRSGKSCRLRWCNQLSPQVEHRPFTAEEDAAIIRAHALHGNKWATIARMLSGRTDNAIKNHWNSTLRRRCQNGAAAAEIVTENIAAAKETLFQSDAGEEKESPLKGGAAAKEASFNDGFSAEKCGATENEPHFVGAAEEKCSDRGSLAENRGAAKSDEVYYNGGAVEEMAYISHAKRRSLSFDSADDVMRPRKLTCTATEGSTGHVYRPVPRFVNASDLDESHAAPDPPTSLSLSLSLPGAASDSRPLFHVAAVTPPPVAYSAPDGCVRAAEAMEWMSSAINCALVETLAPILGPGSHGGANSLMGSAGFLAAMQEIVAKEVQSYMSSWQQQQMPRCLGNYSSGSGGIRGISATCAAGSTYVGVKRTGISRIE